MQSLITGNPFALMMDPEAVIEAVERSERLNTLKARVHRPLDKPLIPRVVSGHVPGTTVFDQSIDAAPDETGLGDLDDMPPEF